MINTHVVSLDLALALRDAGYPQENALFYWHKRFLEVSCEEVWELKNTNKGKDSLDVVASPLSSEILARLPDGLISNGNEDEPFQLTLAKNETDYCANYEAVRSGQIDLMFEEVENDEVPANALANLFLHLRKASLI